MQLSKGNPSLEYDLKINSGALSSTCTIFAHPHPKLGGNLNNPVVKLLSEKCHTKGFSTLIFNTRGVGKSSGSSTWTGKNEIDDFVSIFKLVLEHEHIEKLIFVGYSFGAAVGFAAVHNCISDLDGFKSALLASIAISYPKGCKSSCILGSHFKFVDNESRKLFVLGTRDSSCSVATLENFIEESVSEPKTFLTVEGADHFWGGYDSQLSEIVMKFISENRIETNTEKE